MQELHQHNSQKSLADTLSLSVGKTNYILKALSQKGFIKIENFLNSDSKMKYKYLLTKKGLNEKIILTESFIQRKKNEYDELIAQLEIDKENITKVNV